jgi:DNA-binding transcriptional LysR family regulator
VSDFRLKVFRSVAKNLSFTKASQELFVSQPAITKHIQELEAAYQTRLFDRQGSRISLTESGNLLLEHCERILEDYKRLEYEMHLLHNEYTGGLKLGASTTIAQYVLPPLLASFIGKFPQVSLSLLNGNSREIEAALQEHRIDLGFVEGVFRLPNIRYTTFLEDDLGAVYGLLDISRHYLGVAPFWFWNQQQFEPKPFVSVPEGRITGPAAAVGLRGWDLSDAPWLSAWADATENGWEMIFESLLRCRGNMVRTDKQADLAAAMGLRPVQNPQTPLGAAPQQAAAENPEERHKIWQDSIRTLKTSPRIWALGIDGMGGDPDGTASTAALQEQWQLLNATVPGAAAYILLQGETVALYQEGKLKIPDSVIPVLTPAPSASSAGGPGPGAQHGLWFSLCRRDKLTGNPMTAYPGGDTAVNGMLQGAWRGGVRSFWMVGTGDLRPSLMELNLAGALWCTPDTDCAAQRTAYLRCTYRAPDGWALTDSALEDLSVCLRARAESAVQAGSPPQPVGEAFLTRSTRLFASAWLCGKTQGPIQELAALLPAESYAEQLAAYQQLCTSALENYETLLPGCSYAGRATTPLWQEQVVFSVRLYLYALRGAVRFCTAREQFLDKDWQNCFCTLGRANWLMRGLP